MSHFKDLTGQKFGRFLVIKRDLIPQEGRKRTKWICQCECGNIRSVVSTDLLNGHSNSCGCYQKDQASKSLTTIRSRNKYFHNTKTKSYRIWRAMLRRCENPNAAFYEYYGGRGIKVCERWHDYYNFLSDMGEPSDKDTIDRINVNKNYSPDNCRWATMKEQSANRRGVYRIKYNNETYCLKTFCEKFGLNYYSALSLYKNGMSIEHILCYCKVKPRPKPRHDEDANAYRHIN